MIEASKCPEKSNRAAIWPEFDPFFPSQKKLSPEIRHPHPHPRGENREKAGYHIRRERCVLRRPNVNLDAKKKGGKKKEGRRKQAREICPIRGAEIPRAARARTRKSGETGDCDGTWKFQDSGESRGPRRPVLGPRHPGH